MRHHLQKVERKICMSKKAIENIRFIYGIVLSVMLIVTGILLMIACVNVYKIGNRPFTTENIANAFAKIAIFVWVTVGLTVIRLIAKLFFPDPKSARKAIKDKKITLAHLQSKLNMAACDENTLSLIKKEQKTHTVLQIATIAIACVAAIPAAIYAFNFNNYSADYNASVIAACLWVLPCAFVAMGAFVAFLYLEEACLDRQLKHVKAAFVQFQKASNTVEHKTASPAIETSKQRDYTKLIWSIRIAFIVAAIALIIAGILNGGMADVLSKATNICTECIGLG